MVVISNRILKCTGNIAPITYTVIQKIWIAIRRVRV
jgi:hypothetical protein